MRLIKRSNLELCVRRHPECRQQVANWIAMVRAARWTNPDELRRTSSFPARPIPNDRVIFNIKGSDFRLICAVRYADPESGFTGIVYLKFFGTHSEYDRIDATTVEFTEGRS